MDKQCNFAMLEIVLALAVTLIILLALLIFIAAVLKFARK